MLASEVAADAVLADALDRKRGSSAPGGEAQTQKMLATAIGAVLYGDLRKAKMVFMQKAVWPAEDARVDAVRLQTMQLSGRPDAHEQFEAATKKAFGAMQALNFPVHGMMRRLQLVRGVAEPGRSCTGNTLLKAMGETPDSRIACYGATP